MSPVTAYLGVAPPDSTAATTSPLAMPMCSLSGRSDASLSCDAADLHLERRAHGPLGIVAVGDGRAEDRQHAVARMVDHLAAVSRDRAVHQRVKAIQQRLHLLGVHAGAELRVAGDVGEDNGGLAALSFRRMQASPSRIPRQCLTGRALLSRMSALGTELGLLGKRAAAVATRARQRERRIPGRTSRSDGSRAGSEGTSSKPRRFGARR